MSGYRTSYQLIQRYSISSSQLFPRASPIRRKLPLLTPPFSATVAGNFTSHLPVYFNDVTKRCMLSSLAVYADSLFREEDVSHLLEATRSSSSLKSQQVMVDVASRRPPSSSIRQRRSSPARSPCRSPAQRLRQSSGSPLRNSKRVRFDSPAPSSALKSPRKSHFRD